MSEMLIDGAKLDACLDAEADAIRAKTGDSNDIPFDYANDKGFADAIAAIPSGGGFSLLASGSYTLASQGDTVRIPVSFSGDPINVFVIYRGNGTGVAHTHAWAFMATLPTSELETLFDVASDTGPKSALSRSTGGTDVLQIPVRARFESNNTIIDVRRTGSSYPCLAGQYDWYIYGEEVAS